MCATKPKLLNSPDWLALSCVVNLMNSAHTERGDGNYGAFRDPHGAVFNDVAVFRDQLALFGLLTLNAMSYFFHFLFGLWASAFLVVLVLIYSVIVNRRHMLARHFSWANIFLALLALFHLGYYLPAKLGLIDEIDLLPSVTSTVCEVAVLLFSAAVLAFELGVLSGCRFAWKRKSLGRGTEPLMATVSSTLLRIGLPILGISVVLLVIFVLQIGSIRNIFQMDYKQYWDFMTDSDSRFLETGIVFCPVGVLITYVALLFRGPRNRQLMYIRLFGAAFIIWLLLVGSRGQALLLLLGLLYVGHLCKRPVPWRTIVLVGVFSLVGIPLIATYRNVAVGDRLEAVQDAKLVPLAAAVEMGQTFRTLVGFVDFFWNDHYPLMMGKSYWMAVPTLLPNVGLSKGSVPNGEYYRSAMWITEMLDPVTARVSSGGLGSTGIGEPYANFGYLGVVGFFWLIGLVIGGLEQYFLLTRSGFVIAVICGIFASINWYVRDDFYGTLRTVVWALVVIVLLFYLPRKGIRSVKPGSPFNEPAHRRPKSPSLHQSDLPLLPE